MVPVVALVILLILFVATLPVWKHSRAWGYGPGGGLGLAMVIVAILLLTDVI